LAGFLANRTFILNDTNWRESYAPNGTILGLGDTCYRRKLANTLEYIANNGADVFYSGSDISRNIVKKIQQTGGIMTEADLAGYKALVKEPTMITYRQVHQDVQRRRAGLMGRNKKIFSTRAPSSGAITLSALKIFEGFDGNGYNGTAQPGTPGYNVTEQRRE
jgi:gamma-glutamyltranspeptidase/glutathione hydrolase